MAMATKDDLDLDYLVQEDRVHRRLYTDPAIFDLEMRAIFEQTWVFVGHESEVLHPGDYKTTYIGRSPVILIRDRDGAVHVLINRCMHRGAVVCRDEKGNTSALRCAYHGWTYKTDGELAIVTGRNGYGPEFDPSEFGLRHAPRVGIYRGFVFASLTEEGDTLDDYLGKAKYYIDVTCDASPVGEVEVRSGMQRYSYRGNWKFQVENWIDSYHGQFTHETAFAIRALRQGHALREADQELPVGVNTTFARGHGTANNKNGRASQWGRIPTQFPEYWKELCDVHGEERAQLVIDESDLQLMMFPNFFLQMRRQQLRVIRPVTVDRTDVFSFPYTVKGAPHALNKWGIDDVGYWASAAGFGQPDDTEAWARCYDGLQSDLVDWVIFMRGLGQEWVEPDGEIAGQRTTEVQLRGIYKEWKRLMRLALDGR